MKVSELAKRAGVAPSAIRFYEREGVLPAAPRSESGYRDYGDDDLNRVRVLATLRSLGLDLHEAGRLASMCSDGRCDEMAADLIPQIRGRSHSAVHESRFDERNGSAIRGRRPRASSSTRGAW